MTRVETSKASATTATLQAGPVGSPKDLAATETDPVALPEPTACPLQGDGDIMQLAVLIAKSFREDHRRAQEGSLAAEKTMKAEGMAKVRELNREADDIQAVGYAKGAGQIAGGLLKAGGAAWEGAGEIDQVHNKTADSLGQIRDGKIMGAFGGSAEGLGALLGAGSEADKVRHEAKAETHRLGADLAKQAYDRQQDAGREAKDLERRIKELLSGILGAKNDALRTAAQRA